MTSIAPIAGSRAFATAFEIAQLRSARNAASSAVVATGLRDGVNPTKPFWLKEAAADLGRASAHTEAARSAWQIGARKFDAIPVVIELNKASHLLGEAVDRNGRAYLPLLERVNEHAQRSVALLDAAIAALSPRRQA